MCLEGNKEIWITFCSCILFCMKESIKRGYRWGKQKIETFGIKNILYKSDTRLRIEKTKYWFIREYYSSLFLHKFNRKNDSFLFILDCSFTFGINSFKYELYHQIRCTIHIFVFTDFTLWHTHCPLLQTKQSANKQQTHYNNNNNIKSSLACLKQLWLASLQYSSPICGSSYSS